MEQHQTNQTTEAEATAKPFDFDPLAELKTRIDALEATLSKWGHVPPASQPKPNP